MGRPTYDELVAVLRDMVSTDPGRRALGESDAVRLLARATQPAQKRPAPKKGA